MALTSGSIEATCLCKAARSSLNSLAVGQFVKAAFCHCNSCRHLSGCMCITSLPLPTETGSRLAEDLVPSLVGFEFSKDRIMHYFCPTCGTHMLANILPRGQQDAVNSKWFVMCGTLQRSKRMLYYPSHEYVADTIDGGFTDFLKNWYGRSVEKWAGHPRISQQLPLGWRSTNAVRGSPPSASNLHASCKCGGVEFWICRPAGLKYPGVVCVCESCRLGSGMESFAVAFASLPISSLTLDKEGRQSVQKDLGLGTMKLYESSADVRRGFCGVCGASVLVQKRHGRTVNVVAGLLNAVEGARAEDWLLWDFSNVRFRYDAVSEDDILQQTDHGCIVSDAAYL